MLRRCVTKVLGPMAMALTAALVDGGCAWPECARPDYTRAECRVVAENMVARLRTSTDVEIRFQHPDAATAESWDAFGVVDELGPGRARARVAAPGDFAISVEPGLDSPAEFQLVVENIDPRVVVSVGPSGREIDLPPPLQPGTSRAIDLVLAAEPTWVRGRTVCPSRFRIAALGDIQTNPFQFERIVDRLHQEIDDAESIGEPLLALIVLGDLTELSQDVEFELVDEMLKRLPIPAAVVPGNHDIFSSARAIYNRTFGPGNYAFELCSARIALLDTGNGGLAPSVEGRLTELFERDRARFLIMGAHYPVYPGLTGNGWSREDQAHHVMAELAAADADLVLAGHLHALLRFPDIPVGGKRLDEIIVGTAGANQGYDIPRYGYVRVTVAERIESCFVEVPPLGADGPLYEPLETLAYCE